MMESISETVMILALDINDGGTNVINESVKGFEIVVHVLGRGKLKMWLRMLMRDLQGLESDVEASRKKGEQDAD